MGGRVLSVFLPNNGTLEDYDVTALAQPIPVSSANSDTVR